MKPAEQPVSHARSSVGNLGTRLAVFPLGFLTSLIVARTLGAQDLGAYSLAALFSTLIVPICGLGMGDGFVYLLSRGTYSAQDAIFSGVIGGALQGVVAGGVVLVLWALSFLGEAGRLLGIRTMTLLVAVLPLYGAQLMVSQMMLGLGRFRSYNRTLLSRALLQPVFLIGLAPWWGLRGAILAVAGATLGSFLHCLFELRGVGWRWRLEPRFMRDAFDYGIKGWTNTLFSTLNLRVDQLLLSATNPAASLGVYSLAVRASEIPWTLTDAVSQVLFFRILKLPEDEQVRLLARIHCLLFWLTAAAAVFGAVLVQLWAVPLLGRNFNQLPALTSALLVGTVGFVTAKILSKLFGARGHNEINGKVGTLGGLVGLVLYACLIPALGAWGAVIGSVLSYIARSLLSVVACRRQGWKLPRGMLVVAPEDLHWARLQLRRLRI